MPCTLSVVRVLSVSALLMSVLCFQAVVLAEAKRAATCGITRPCGKLRKPETYMDHSQIAVLYSLRQNFFVVADHKLFYCTQLLDYSGCICMHKYVYLCICVYAGQDKYN